MLTEEPGFPRKGRRVMKLMDDFLEETMVLALKVFDSQATVLFILADSLPSDQALRNVCLRPPIASIDHCLGDETGRHVIER